jgi:uncharacterized protein YaiE (UPF0345 family)
MNYHTIPITDFNRVRVDSALSIQILRSDTYNIRITPDDTGRIRTEKSGDTLRIWRRGFDWFHPRPRISITMPELVELTLSGACHGEVQGFQSGREFTLRLNGASQLEISQMVTGDLKVDISGASNLTGDIKTSGGASFKVTGASRVKLTGTANNMLLDLSGASQARLAELALNDADVNFSGASSGQLNIKGKLDMNLSGASRLEYSGSPTLGRVQISGASNLRQF